MTKFIETSMVGFMEELNTESNENFDEIFDGYRQALLKALLSSDSKKWVEFHQRDVIMFDDNANDDLHMNTDSETSLFDERKELKKQIEKLEQSLAAKNPWHSKPSGPSF